MIFIYSKEVLEKERLLSLNWHPFYYINTAIIMEANDKLTYVIGYVHTYQLKVNVLYTQKRKYHNFVYDYIFVINERTFK